MKRDGYYSSGQFARMAHVTLRTIRYYDKQNLLKPSLVTEAGARFYTEEDLAKLQQILLFKFLGFSLDDIRQMTLEDADSQVIQNSLRIQKTLIRERIAELQLVESAIADTEKEIEAKNTVDWSRMQTLIQLTGMERSLKNQYQNASNISARIRLHSLYSYNKEGWFPWILRQCRLKDGMKILEIGCGDGALWIQNLENIPKHLHVKLTDISDGMLRDVKRALREQGEDTESGRFEFLAFDCSRIPYESDSFDLVIANHVLFYCENVEAVLKEVHRVLKSGGRFAASTYGHLHMQEVSRLVRDFDDRIKLAAEELYERFGKENGEKLLSAYFQEIQWEQYEDYLLVDDEEPLISYILSCHGNQNQYLVDRYKEFRAHAAKRTKGGFRITKDAGVFLCKK